MRDKDIVHFIEEIGSPMLPVEGLEDGGKAIVSDKLRRTNLGWGRDAPATSWTRWWRDASCILSTRIYEVRTGTGGRSYPWRRAVCSNRTVRG